MRFVRTVVTCVLPAAIAAYPQAPKGGAPGAKGPLPAKGDNGQMGGIFGMGGISMSSMQSSGGSLLATGSESPKGGASVSGGTGKFKAHYLADAGLREHTVYAPKSPPPADAKLPVIVWGNGGVCSQN
jgi:hypothetical protein